MLESETKAVSSLIESKKEDTLCFLTKHAYGQLTLTPYGYTKNKPSNYEELLRLQPTCEETMAALLSLLDNVYENYWSPAVPGRTATNWALAVLRFFTSASCRGLLSYSDGTTVEVKKECAIVQRPSHELKNTLYSNKESC
ncbi:Carboxypeptidase O [Lemmus lemmus]